MPQAVRWLLPFKLSLVSSTVAASGLDLSLDLDSLYPDTEVVRGESNEPKQASVKTGLGLTLGDNWLALDVDYDLRGLAPANQPTGDVIQQFNTRVESKRLESLLGVDLGLSGNVLLREGGDAYQRRLQPEFSRGLGDIARLKFAYQYVLDKPSRAATEKAIRGYQVVLDGELEDGRLTWRGSYRSNDQFDHRQLRTGSTEVVDLVSRYQVARTLHMEFSGAMRHSSTYPQRGEQLVTEKRYGAALGWSPSTRYSVGVRFDTVEQEALANPVEVRGSGSISWSPRPDLQFQLDYGDQLHDGEAGWLIRTRFDLSG